MFQKLIELLLSDGITIRANFEITLQRTKKVNGKRYPAVCQFCGMEIGDYQYPSGASRALAEHLKTCEAKPDGTIQESPNMIKPEEIPDWLKQENEGNDHDNESDYHDA